MIKNKEYYFQNNQIKLNTSSKKSYIKESSKGVYEIKLVLYIEEKKKSMEFITQVSVINDKELEMNETN